MNIGAFPCIGFLLFLVEVGRCFILCIFFAQNPHAAEIIPRRLSATQQLAKDQWRKSRVHLSASLSFPEKPEFSIYCIQHYLWQNRRFVSKIECSQKGTDQHSQFLLPSPLGLLFIIANDIGGKRAEISFLSTLSILERRWLDQPP